MKIIVLVTSLAMYIMLQAQTGTLQANLPVGKHAVGFKIITITDSSRVPKPLYNYFGEKEKEDRYQKITIHLWYPAKPGTGKGQLTYGEYTYNHLLKNSNEVIASEKLAAIQNSYRENFQGFFGKIANDEWEKLKGAKLTAQKEAEALTEKFPLLVGMLRPLSTSVTNELMASNGFVVAMVLTTSGKLPLGYITDVADMQHAIAYLTKTGLIDENNIGTYGFSGSGFSQVLLAMNDPRIGALADIESALYGGGIWEIFSSSNYYDVSKLKVPFLHIYGKYLTERDVKFEEFYRTKYAHRYHLLLNQPNLHHWDVATEGRASTTVLHVRGDKEPGIKASFELSNIYLLHFFNATLKKSTSSQKIIDTKTSIAGHHDSLWSIQQYPALKPPPDKAQFEELINRKGINEAIRLAREYQRLDSAADFIHQNVLNQFSRQYHSQGKSAEGLALMQLAVEFYPQQTWLWNNLADMQENLGNKEEAIRCSEKVIELLKDFKGTEQSGSERLRRSAVARLKKLNSKPPKRAHHELVYDEPTQTILMTSGSTPVDSGKSYEFFNDLWSFDGEKWKRSGTAGDKRSGIRMAYNTKTNKLFSFGGYANNNSLADLRVLENGEWKTLSNDTAMKAAEPGFVYDIHRDKLIAFGGSARRGVVHNITWEWNGSSWKKFEGASPEGRQAFAMVYDTRRKITVVFGGVDAQGKNFNDDILEFDGTQWKIIINKTTGPGPRISPGFVYDSKRGLLIIFGGISNGVFKGDTWSWDGKEWRTLAEAGPSPRVMGYMAYDKKRDRIVLFGGRPGWLNDANDTWEWDGKEWKEIK